MTSQDLSSAIYFVLEKYSISLMDLFRLSFCWRVRDIEQLMSLKSIMAKVYIKITYTVIFISLYLESRQTIMSLLVWQPCQHPHLFEDYIKGFQIQPYSILWEI